MSVLHLNVLGILCGSAVTLIHFVSVIGLKSVSPSLMGVLRMKTITFSFVTSLVLTRSCAQQRFV